MQIDAATDANANAQQSHCQARAGANRPARCSQSKSAPSKCPNVAGLALWGSVWPLLTAFEIAGWGLLAFPTPVAVAGYAGSGGDASSF